MPTGVSRSVTIIRGGFRNFSCELYLKITHYREVSIMNCSYYDLGRQSHHGPSCDYHHIFFQRSNWSRGALKILRQHPYCKIYIPRDLHDAIHVKIRNVPTPSFENAIEALKQLRYFELYDNVREHDDFEQRLKVLIFLFEAIEPDTVACLKKQLEIVRNYNKPS